MQGPLLIKSTILPYSVKPNNRYPSSLLVDYPLLAQRGQVSGQPPIAHVQQYGRAYTVPTTALDQPLGMNGVDRQPIMDVPVVTQYSASATFPPKNPSLLHTHASYSNQPISKFISNNCGNWTLALDVPIPRDTVHPTLTSLSYTVKYSTANDHLACVVRSNILLANMESEKPEEDISTNVNTHRDDKTSGGATAVCLSSVLGIKANDLENQWNHFIDRQHIPLNVHVVQSSRLYLQVHISEYPTVAMLRSLSMDIFATWLDDQEGRRLLQRRQEAEKGMGIAADDKMQAKIEEAVRRLPKERQCPQGYAWVQTSTGFKCKGGGHEISWEELAALGDSDSSNGPNDPPSPTADDLAKEAEAKQHAAETRPATEVGSAADDKMQAKIEEAVRRLPKERQCPQGYAWVQSSTGFKCTGGGHSISWEELNK
ncbi:hypothetical protein F4604DRAFT_1672768 [Suillus subluteus]|nr:hypothetical protein F4604DRAFT_1672768 [Suillus subluteus]